MTEILGQQQKYYVATLYSPLELELSEETVRKKLGYDKYQILTDKDWDNACSLVIKDFLAQAKLPVNRFQYKEVKKEDKEAVKEEKKKQNSLILD